MPSASRSATGAVAPLVLLDANALFLPFESGLDLETEIGRNFPGATIAVPASVRRELEMLVARRVPRAELARSLADRFARVPGRGRGDSAILALAARLHAIVATADRGLRDRLSAAGLVVLVPRDRTRLTVFQRRAAGPAEVTVKNGPPLERLPPRRSRSHARRRHAPVDPRA